MKKKLSNVILVSFLVFGFATVSYALPSESKHKNMFDQTNEMVRGLLSKAKRVDSKQAEVKVKKDQKQITVAKNDDKKHQESKKGGEKGNDFRLPSNDHLTFCAENRNNCRPDHPINGHGSGWKPGDGYTPPGGPNPVPEPATMLLLGAGIAGIAGARIRKKKK